MIAFGKISIALTSPPDRDYLVVELSSDGYQIAEINRERGYLAVEMYARRDGSAWELPLLDLQAALTAGAALLEGRPGLP